MVSVKITGGPSTLDFIRYLFFEGTDPLVKNHYKDPDYRSPEFKVKGRKTRIKISIKGIQNLNDKDMWDWTVTGTVLVAYYLRSKGKDTHILPAHTTVLFKYNPNTRKGEISGWEECSSDD